MRCSKTWSTRLYGAPWSCASPVVHSDQGSLYTATRFIKKIILVHIRARSNHLEMLAVQCPHTLSVTLGGMQAFFAASPSSSSTRLTTPMLMRRPVSIYRAAHNSSRGYRPAGQIRPPTCPQRLSSCKRVQPPASAGHLAWSAPTPRADANSWNTLACIRLRTPGSSYTVCESAIIRVSY
ncbi:hypothetical protein SAMN06265337_2059 [Hymenobacter gelipurpurascens]|uniref:Uncharacterized protein n=1 Tax=Hymenobacter gelipurpurascens TaxID=89968 RepID=A0A212TP03_9BACT|nr:hypothetical protein SAMN06265337_2059 [Hymenobacter gelipurpurascens]